MRKSWSSVLLATLATACGPGKVRFDAGGEAPDLSFVFSAEDLTAPPPLEDASRMRDRDAACAMVSAEATLIKKPVDIIFVIDNSGSMTQEIQGVEININQNFAAIMNQSGLDYRVIMVTSHGLSARQMICVGKPLSGHDCNPPPAVPVNTKRYFHYDYNIQSTDSCTKLLNTYNLPDKHGLAPQGWSRYLRPDAVKMFIEVTDDASSMPALQFDAALLALQPALFGIQKKRGYIFHTIAGLAGNVPPTKPWGPKEPEVPGKCGAGAVNNGIEYQRLSILTGGMRFPICEWANFDGVFKEVAKGIEEGSKVACEMAMPMAPPGQSIDAESLVVEYAPSNGGPREDFAQAKSLADCMPDAFYRLNDRIILCPDACTRVQKDNLAKLRVLFDCEIPLQ